MKSSFPPWSHWVFASSAAMGVWVILLAVNQRHWIGAVGAGIWAVSQTVLFIVAYATRERPRRP